jgi:DNA modification methylase
MRLLLGDCRESLRTLDAGSVQCCVTSPPYFGLRDYGHPGQIGREETPEQFVEALISVFREVRRVLRDDGTSWLNLGDSYAGSWGNQGRKTERGGQRPVNGPMIQRFHANETSHATDCDMGDDCMCGAGDASRYPQRTCTGSWVNSHPTLKPKDLIGIPWRVALALQADGWWLRSDVIWHKPNPMPSSVTDRPTTAHEYLFLLTKSARYFYDADAVREPAVYADPSRGTVKAAARERNVGGRADGFTTITQPGGVGVPEGGRNRRTVWTIATSPYAGAHFAVMPPALVEPCILAGSRPGDTVLDPFGGSGTVGMVANWHGRESILCELNPAYAPLIEERVRAPREKPAVQPDPRQLPLLGGAA